MDSKALSDAVKELNEANTAGKTEDVTRLLEKLRKDVQPTEELLRSSKAGVAIGKLRNHSTPGVSTLAKEIVKLWKDAIEESKRKRKREDGDKDDAVKRVKGEGSSAAASPAAASPSGASPDRKPRTEAVKSEVKTEASGSSPPRRPPLSTIDSSRKDPRTAASDGVEKTLRAEEAEGEDVRDKCVVMMYNALAGDSTADKKILTERARGIEKAAYDLVRNTGNEYRAKMRSLFLNLKDKQNPALRNEIVLGYIEAAKVAAMSKEEMASESVRALNEKLASDNLFKAKAVGETQAETDAFKCSRCQQRKCTYYQMQTRSADEPMTTFVTYVFFTHDCFVC
ncbi:transcription factor S-II, central domain-domain-containing protein [Kockovaella imperatae]|uniref:Transcription factor S-II, central domain-domain-containing protein n=1 Tax=Kockovaella imperatae TaxID=4999 RepID=A0A1Y1UQ29_9TREE|nr:transcription factor S-II, central domain-domain-containing protein [Kockovaella imperatae]ORX39245.1 transcription factor S-II, central domain-domain-containing protein [Kockovaella imperatae]